MWVMAGLLLCGGRAYAQDANMAAGGSESTWRGTLADAAAGASLDQGAVSSDGRRDLIVGAPGVNGDPGKVFVIFGGQIPTGSLSLAEADVVVHGASPSDRFGTSTAAGNIRTTETSDAPRDLVVGAPGVPGSAGAVYLFAAGSGFPEGAVRRAANQGGADGYTLKIVGRPGDQLGTALATADVDNDGYRDIVIGAPGTGRVYVVRGGTLPGAGSIINLTDPGAALTEITGPGIGSVIAAGDVTADGRSEILLGAPLADALAGKVYLLNTAAGLLGPIALPGPAVVFNGLAPGDLAGISIALPTFDEDNVKDIVIGAPGADPSGRLDAGAVYVIWGRSSGFNSGSLAGSNLTLIGQSTGMLAGAYVTSGSVNRDSHDDLVMLAAGARGGQGELQLYYGGNRAARTGVFDLGAVVARRFFASPSPGPLRTAAVFEVTGEGARDVMVGVPSASVGGLSGNGLVYFSLSPRMRLSPKSITVKASRASARSTSIQVVNPGIGDVTWTATSSASWLTVNSPNGVSSAGAPGTLTFTVTVPPAAAAGRTSANITIRSTSVHLTMTLTLPVTMVCCSPSDFDGDNRADLVLYRPSDGGWYIRHSSVGYASNQWARYQWGISTDVPLSADFDGDGKTDLVVYRPSTGEWFVQYSSSNFTNFAVYQWGTSTDTPLVADFDGDGKSDLALYRPSDGGWYVRYSSLGYTLSQWGYFQWGMSTDIPLAADFDGDGRTDLVVYRPSDGGWYIRYSSMGYSLAEWGYTQWGTSGDKPLVADFDGDGKSDLALYRPSDGGWYIRYSSTGYALNQWAYYQWGMPGDKPIAADFDGDGRTDLGLYRPSDGGWYIRYSSVGYALNQWAYYQWGVSSDSPMAR
jgi:hypothetical protein